MKQLLKSVARRLGVEIHRAADPDLPFLREVVIGPDRFPFWIANPHAKRWWHKPEIMDNAEFRAQKQMCAPGDLVFDVGAHHGLFTVLYARWVGAAGRVHAFEAAGENALVLCANVGVNRLTNCVCVHAAVGARSGRATIAGERVLACGEDGKVPLISLDEYSAAHGIERVDVLKIDVEGFEGEVLRGAARILKGRPKIDLELHASELSRYNSSVGEVLGRIDLEDYRGAIMVRPDWQTMRPLPAAAELPKDGVVNLFLFPVERRGGPVIP
jgi:FkbM family methyltransferase